MTSRGLIRINKQFDTFASSNGIDSFSVSIFTFTSYKERSHSMWGWLGWRFEWGKCGESICIYLYTNKTKHVLFLLLFACYLFCFFLLLFVQTSFFFLFIYYYYYFTSFKSLSRVCATYQFNERKLTRNMLECCFVCKLLSVEREIKIQYNTIRYKRIHYRKWSRHFYTTNVNG